MATLRLLGSLKKLAQCNWSRKGSGALFLFSFSQSVFTGTSAPCFSAETYALYIVDIASAARLLVLSGASP